MGILDVNQHLVDRWQELKPNEGTHLPVTFEEGFKVAWDEANLFSKSSAYGYAQLQGLYHYRDEVLRRTGKDLGPAMNSLEIGGDFSKLADEVKKLKAANPEFDIPDPSLDEFNRRGEELSRQVRAAYADQQTREGGGFGRFMGGLAGAVTDPINIALMPVGGGEGGIVMNALRFGGLAAVSQEANEAMMGNFRERVQPGYAASGEPGENILQQAAGGFVLGGGTKMLGNVWTKVKTGSWPVTVRDAGNALESEAHVQQTNIYQGVRGEVAHREAITAAIDSILKEEPVNVDRIITPDIEASARGVMTRLEGERAMALPIFDERTTRLISEEAQLRERDSLLQTQLGSIGEPSPEAAQRLAAVQQVEQQMEAATGADRRALARRRDQLLADQTPEQLQAQAAPQELQRTVTAERAGIAARLEAIAEERARIEAQQRLQPQMQPAMGATMPARLVPLERVRTVAAELTEAAKAERVAATEGPAPELPLAATAAEAKAETATDALRSSIRQMTESGGHELTPEEVNALAERFARMSPDEAANEARRLKVEPRAMLAEPALPPREIQPAKVAPGDVAPVPTPEEITKMLGTPEFEATLRGSLDRTKAAAGPKEVRVPVGIDKDGNPIFGKLDDLVKNSVDDYRKAALEIQACATQQEAAE